MGLFDGLFGGLVGGIADAYLGDAMSKRSQQRQFTFNKELQQLQNTYNTQEWQRQFDATNAYNTPAEQVARLRAAGINPSAAFSQGSAVIGQSAATPAAAGTSLPSMSAPVGGFSSIADNLSKLSLVPANIAKQGEVKAYTNLLASQASNEVVRNSLLSFDDWVNKTYGKEFKDNQLSKSYQDWLLAIAQTSNISADTDVKVEEKLETASRRFLNQARERLSNREYALLQIRLNNEDSLIKSEIRRNLASSAQSSAAASYQSALAQTENRNRDIRNELLRLEGMLQRNEVNVSDRTVSSRISKALEEAKQMRYITGQQFQKLLQDKFETNTQWLHEAERLVDVVLPKRSISRSEVNSHSEVRSESNNRNTNHNFYYRDN